MGIPAAIFNRDWSLVKPTGYAGSFRRFFAFLTNLDRMIALANAIMYMPNNVLDITLYNGLTMTKCVAQLKVLVKILLYQICCYIRVH